MNRTPSPSDRAPSGQHETAAILRSLQELIASRKRERPDGSYVVQLLDGGHAAICSKIIEEAYEVVSAAADGGSDRRANLVHELADLLFHLLVLMGGDDIPLELIEEELAGRFGIGGLQAKAARAEQTP